MTTMTVTSTHTHTCRLCSRNWQHRDSRCVERESLVCMKCVGEMLDEYSNRESKRESDNLRLASNH